jgi:membrane protein implicated in regulation of membrane protease activity
MPTQEAEHGVGTAAKNVAEHASTLARLELELALLEVKRKVAALGVGIGMSIAAGIFGLFALGFGLAAAAAGLALGLAMWASLLIVCGALVLLAVILLFAGLSSIKKGAPPVPEQAIREVKLTTEAIRNGRS